MARASNAEYLLVRKTAEKYRRQGYEVTLDAPLDFLPGCRADLLASKADEVTVIEIKSRSSLAADPGSVSWRRPWMRGPDGVSSYCW